MAKIISSAKGIGGWRTKNASGQNCQKKKRDCPSVLYLNVYLLAVIMLIEEKINQVFVNLSCKTT